MGTLALKMVLTLQELPATSAANIFSCREAFLMWHNPEQLPQKDDPNSEGPAAGLLGAAA